MNLRAAPLAVLLLVTILLTGCSSTSDPAPPEPPAEATTGVPSEVPSSVPVAPSSDPSVAMPDLVGRRLSDAEATLTAAGLMSVNAVDASGQGRRILEKNNWIVQRQNPAAGEGLADGVVVTLGVTKPTDDQDPVEPEQGVIPDVVCHDLQEAQDAMRAAGFYAVLAKDGLGQGRYPVLDRNWVVLGQSAKPGSSPEESTVIELTVVKFGEPTGRSGCKS